MKKLIKEELIKPKVFQEFYGLSADDYKSCSFDEIKKYNQLGHDLQSQAIFDTIKKIRVWFINLLHKNNKHL